MKILVRETNWVGDAILTIPALEAIRTRWPQAKITLLARPAVAGLFFGQPFVDSIITLETKGGVADFAEMEAVARRLRAEQFDSGLLLPNSFSSAWLFWRAGIRERIGYARDGRSLLLTRRAPRPLRGEIPKHETYYYLNLLHKAGWLESIPEISEIRLVIPAEARARAESRLEAEGSAAGRTRIALAPGAAFGSAKCWLPERFAEVADRLIAEFRADVVLFGTASEKGICSRIAERMKHSPIQLAGRTIVADLPPLLASCRLFVGNDSGASHVAAAAGLPVVVVFGPTDPEGTAPVTPRRSIVREPVFCSPCFLRTCPIDHRCMTRISSEAVFIAARGWLERG